MEWWHLYYQPCCGVVMFVVIELLRKENPTWRQAGEWCYYTTPKSVAAVFCITKIVCVVVLQLLTSIKYIQVGEEGLQ